MLLPGFPLDHRDHRFVTELVLGRLERRPRVGLYVEQPYAMIIRREVPVPESPTSTAIGNVEWRRLRPGPRAWLAKQRALRAYRTQMLAFARPLSRVPALVALHEHHVGGETIGWLERLPDVGRTEVGVALSAARSWTGGTPRQSPWRAERARV